MLPSGLKNKYLDTACHLVGNLCITLRFFLIDVNISSNALKNIIKHLKNSLEELTIPLCNEPDFDLKMQLTKLQSMTKLKILNIRNFFSTTTSNYWKIPYKYVIPHLSGVDVKVNDRNDKNVCKYPSKECYIWEIKANLIRNLQEPYGDKKTACSDINQHQDLFMFSILLVFMILVMIAVLFQIFVTEFNRSCNSRSSDVSFLCNMYNFLINFSPTGLLYDIIAYIQSFCQTGLCKVTENLDHVLRLHWSQTFVRNIFDYSELALLFMIFVVSIWVSARVTLGAATTNYMTNQEN